MKAASFAYHRPTTLPGALQILSDVAPKDGRVIAGGQSLVPMMAYRIATPAHLVDINRIDELARLSIGDGAVSIAACVRHAAFERIETQGPTGALLRAIVHHVGHYPIRARGTFCGSLAHSDPASEWCLAAATLEATLVAKSVSGTREIPAVDYFQGVMTTALNPDEILVEARLPLLAADTRCAFLEFSRRAGDFAIASVMATARLVDGRLCDTHFGVGGAEANPRRIGEVEALLDGEAPHPGLWLQAADCAAAVVEPLEDSINAAEFRRDLVRALTRRVLVQAFT